MKLQWLFGGPVRFTAVFLFLSCSAIAAAEGNAVLAGKVFDVDGKPFAGARIFLYRSAEVRRAADFLSARTDSEGAYRVVVPPGRFWCIARSKKADDYGPLMPGDKHSGDPVEADIPAEGAAIRDFVIADIKDAQRKKYRDREGPVKITGKIVDDQGAPVRTAYVFAHRTGMVATIPDFLSPWVDDEGRFALYVPRGSYFLGVAFSLPLDQSAFMHGEIAVDNERPNVTIVTPAGIQGKKPAAP